MDEGFCVGDLDALHLCSFGYAPATTPKHPRKRCRLDCVDHVYDHMHDDTT